MTLRLLGFNTLSEKLSFKQPDESPRIEAIYHTQERVGNKYLPKEQKLAEFDIRDQQLVFQWENHKEETRDYQRLLREAVLKVQVAGRPPSFYALKMPIGPLSPLELGKVLSEPYDEQRICGLDKIPGTTSRKWIFENVQMQINGVTWNGTNPPGASTNQWSFPQMAEILGLTDIYMVFEEKPDELDWKIDTNPSLTNAYQNWNNLSEQLFAANAGLRKATLNLNRNNAALADVDAQIAAGNKRLQLKRATLAKAVTNAQNDGAKHTQAIINLTPKVAAANAAYRAIKPKFNLSQADRVTLSAYRMVEGVKLQVLTVR